MRSLTNYNMGSYLLSPASTPWARQGFGDMTRIERSGAAAPSPGGYTSQQQKRMSKTIHNNQW